MDFSGWDAEAEEVRMRGVLVLVLKEGGWWVGLAWLRRDWIERDWIEMMVMMTTTTSVAALMMKMMLTEGAAGRDALLA